MLIKTIQQNSYNDWFLPSVSEVIEMVSAGVPGITDGFMWTSSEVDATTASCRSNINGLFPNTTKTLAKYVYPVRSFITAVSFSVGDTGPAGGKIFYKNGNTYYESSPNGWVSKVWSDPSGLIGVSAQGIAIGTGKTNTDAIIAWLITNGQSNKAAQLCTALNIQV
jgi:hypothetical protein